MFSWVETLGLKSSSLFQQPLYLFLLKNKTKKYKEEFFKLFHFLYFICFFFLFFCELLRKIVHFLGFGFSFIYRDGLTVGRLWGGWIGDKQSRDKSQNSVYISLVTDTRGAMVVIRTIAIRLCTCARQWIFLEAKSNRRVIHPLLIYIISNFFRTCDWFICRKKKRK